MVLKSCVFEYLKKLVKCQKTNSKIKLKRKFKTNGMVLMNSLMLIQTKFTKKRE